MAVGRNPEYDVVRYTIPVPVRGFGFDPDPCPDAGGVVGLEGKEGGRIPSGFRPELEPA